MGTIGFVLVSTLKGIPPVKKLTSAPLIIKWTAWKIAVKALCACVRMFVCCWLRHYSLLESLHNSYRWCFSNGYLYLVPLGLCPLLVCSLCPGCQIMPFVAQLLLAWDRHSQQHSQRHYQHRPTWLVLKPHYHLRMQRLFRKPINENMTHSG